MIIQLTLVHVRQETRTAISNDWARRPPTLRIHAPWVTATISEPHRRQGHTDDRAQMTGPHRRQGHTDDRAQMSGPHRRQATQTTGRCESARHQTPQFTQ